VDVYIHAFLTSASVGVEWSASRPDRFTPRRRSLPVSLWQEAIPSSFNKSRAMWTVVQWCRSTSARVKPRLCISLLMTRGSQRYDIWGAPRCARTGLGMRCRYALGNSNSSFEPFLRITRLSFHLGERHLVCIHNNICPLSRDSSVTTVTCPLAKGLGKVISILGSSERLWSHRQDEGRVRFQPASSPPDT
jgi:hypothetical protein